MVTEYAEKGSLLSYLRNTTLDIRQKLEILKGVALGMIHLEQENVVHLDLSAKNVLLKSDGTVLVGQVLFTYASDYSVTLD